MSKKSKRAKVPVVPKYQPAKLVLVINTTCLGLGKTSWEGVYNLLEVEDPNIISEEELEADSDKKSESTLK